MKIYRVVSATGRTLRLWDNYNSATISAAQRKHRGSKVEVVDVADDAWRTPNRLQELQEKRLTNLFYNLVHTDAEATTELLEALTKRAAEVKQAKQPAAPATGGIVATTSWVRRENLREEAEARLRKMAGAQ